MYGKIFDSMYEGTLYGHWQAIVTFQQMIVLADADGVVDMTPQAIAARTSIPLEIIQAGIKVLEAPDQYSRTPDEDGKRIELLDEHRPWGWHIVNHEKYKNLRDADEIRAQNRERQQRFRDKKKTVTQRNAPSRSVTGGNGESRYTDTDTDTRKQAQPPNGGSTEFWNFGVNLLTEQGVKEGTARSFIGSLLKDYDPKEVESAFRGATGKADAKGYVLGILKGKPKRGQEKAFPI